MSCPTFQSTPETCCGCGGCEQICPIGAIRLCPDQEGFLRPKVDFQLCNKCGVCARVCPAITVNLKKIMSIPRKVYAGRSRDVESVMQSTSGALFFELAMLILEIGGVVYGCGWKQNALQAEQIRVTTPDELERLRQSKYVQSITGSTYQAVRKDLANGIQVLYSGTPCQIAGLKLFLRKEYSNLLTVDLLCHGVPSPLMLEEYVKWIEKREKCSISELKFRAKRNSGYRAYLSYKRMDGKTRIKLAGLQPYLYGFYSGFFNRKSCYTCPFKSSGRAGDITLADFWGLEKAHPEIADWMKYGASLCMFNTERGLSWYRVFSGRVELVPSTLDKAAVGNPALSGQTHGNERPQLRDRIYSELKEQGFDWLVTHRLYPRGSWIHLLIPASVKNFLRKLKHY